MKFLLVNAYLNSKKNNLRFLNFEKAILQVTYLATKLIQKDPFLKKRLF